MQRYAKFKIRALGECLFDILSYSIERGERWNNRVFSFSDVWVNPYGEFYDMARKPASNKSEVSGANGGTPGDLVWVNIKLDEQGIADVIAISAAPDAIGTRLAGVFTGGYGFSLKYNPERKNYSAFITGIQGHASGKLVGISAYGGTGILAVAAVLFKCDLYVADPLAYVTSSPSVGIG